MTPPGLTPCIQESRTQPLKNSASEDALVHTLTMPGGGSSSGIRTPNSAQELSRNEEAEVFARLQSLSYERCVCVMSALTNMSVCVHQ